MTCLYEPDSVFYNVVVLGLGVCHLISVLDEYKINTVSGPIITEDTESKSQRKVYILYKKSVL